MEPPVGARRITTGERRRPPTGGVARKEKFNMTVAELPTRTDDRVEATEAAERIELRESIAESATAGRLYQYSRYLHVGPKAEECEEGEKGTCQNPLHFHAWVRLPNKFQHKDLRDKGLAAKARKMRALRDPETDSYAVLQDRLEALNDDANIGAIADEILAKDWPTDYLTAVADLAEYDDPEDESGERKKWEHIDQDRERYTALVEEELAKPEEEQSEEFKQLGKRIGEYIDELKVRVEAIQEPKRAALAERGIDGVIEVLRKQRIEDEGDGAFLQVYNEWMWYVCTLKPVENGVAHERVWCDLGHVNDPQPGTMWAAAPEVIEAVEQAFNELDQALRQAARGNS
jgi:hypothetical protein